MRSLLHIAVMFAQPAPPVDQFNRLVRVVYLQQAQITSVETRANERMALTQEDIGHIFDSLEAQQAKINELESRIALLENK